MRDARAENEESWIGWWLTFCRSSRKCSAINARSIAPLSASCFRSIICIPSRPNSAFSHKKIRTTCHNKGDVLFLFLFGPSLSKSVEIFFCIKFNDDWRNCFTILTLVLLTGHEPHVGVDTNAQTGRTCYEGHVWSYSTLLKTSRIYTDIIQDYNQPNEGSSMEEAC